MQFDHIVLGARTLEEGREYVYEQLGIRVPLGGSHPRYGTHNAVLRLDSRSYFEIIAIEADVKPACSPRWYALDDVDTIAQLEHGPRVLAWVAATVDIDEICSGHAHSSAYGAGEIVTIQRDDLRWRMWIPNSGKLKNPLLPWLIDWSIGTHPCELLPHSICRIESLQAFHHEPMQMQSALERFKLGKVLHVQNSDKNQYKQQLKAKIQCQDRTAVFSGLEFDCTIRSDA